MKVYKKIIFLYTLFWVIISFLVKTRIFPNLCHYFANNR